MGIWLFLLILVLLILVVLLILIMASTVTIRLHLVLRSKEYRMNVGIRMLYGLVDVQYEVPFRITDTGVHYSDVPLSTDSSTETSDVAVEKNSKNVFRFREYQKLIWGTKGLKNWLLNTLSIVRLSEVRWATSLALDNAAETAVAAGAVWGVKHTILGLLSFYVKLTSTPQLQVLPDFDGPPQLSTDFSFVVRITCGRAIFAGLVLIVRILTIRGGLKTWKNALFRA
ncbi:DUF2953 domain-containing protein [Paenibacillus sp. GCM10028914]|uniref:DUF2953 domain-containing protein n=1 Tax=Paenibacillus sp. GCM10028914 TaxID=3273416 RepID=UPI00360A4190